MKQASILIGSLVATALTAAPAHAGKLTFWRFNENNNRLLFQTEERVQPRAQLIFNPTRVVIDLPDTVLGHSLVNQDVGGAIQEVRVGQFNQETTRLVVELAPGYTLDPEKVKIREERPQRWSVELPPVQRTANPSRRRSALDRRSPRRETPSPLLEVGQSPPNTKADTNHPNFQVTRSGLLLRLDSPPGKEIEVERSEDKKQISFHVPKATLPSDLPSVLPVGDYGISHAEFKSNGNDTAEVTLHVNPESPTWQAFPTLTSKGGLVFLPEGGMGQVRNNLSTPPIPASLTNHPEQSQTTVVQAVDLIDNQLLVRANQPITGTGNWNRVSGVYEITIPNAELADPVQGPQLTRNSPVSQIRVRQQDEETVVVQVQSSPGVRILDRLNQPSENTIAIALRQLQQTTPRHLPHLSNSSQQRHTIHVPQSRPAPSPPSSPLPRGNNQDGLLVVLDPGHGGKDPGAVGIGGLQEKNVVLPISHHVRKTLERNGLQVKMTRWDDRFISLGGRTEMANRADADLFISIHANAISMSRPDVNGTETFYYANGRALAQAIQRSILSKINMRDRGVKKANFYVLRNSAMPAVLVEVGFVTGREDAPRLADPNFRQRMADAIADGILQYVRQTQ
ncbi:N-acetylmuramoyl-L-alanine amidase [Halothece sp. PCC 7418]|uniref:N-acetylmuramoyl-L-alanine amidase n=1 Tax=Halothece sp. (strain PCC 7418) TaxID=65093 RepID=UPI001F19AF3F|nr:N-acetylmuramoyl-L-alanine amidase [Halothece sp. PCC 7418]